jgi:hypothetical protein
LEPTAVVRHNLIMNRIVRARTGAGFTWLAVLASIALVIAFDLYGPVRTNIRAFDPLEVARLDTAMWRSYYDKRPLPLFLELGDLMRRQFHFPPLRSYLVAYHAARAAFLFKGGHSRPDYERALPDLVRYFEAVHRISDTGFDAHRAAELELEWWIVHRQRSPDLPRALADAGAALYRVPTDSLMAYGEARAKAMTIRDVGSDAGTLNERDWRLIEADLQTSWHSLWRAVQPAAATATAAAR